MHAVRKPVVRVRLAFDDWKLQLRHDCELRGMMKAFDTIEDFTLRFFWWRGIDPNVQAIIEDGPNLERRI